MTAEAQRQCVVAIALRLNLWDIIYGYLARSFFMPNENQRECLVADEIGSRRIPGDGSVKNIRRIN